MNIQSKTEWFAEMFQINLFAPSPEGSKLIFVAPFRVGAKKENQIVTIGKIYN